MARSTLACPNCQGRRSRTLNSRSQPDRVNRRRECADCSARFSTVEMVVVVRGSRSGQNMTSEEVALRQAKTKLAALRSALRYVLEDDPEEEPT